MMRERIVLSPFFVFLGYCAKKFTYNSVKPLDIIPLIEYNDIKRDSLDTGGSTMNRYNDFFTNMSDEEWEKFAVEVLKCAGYRIRTLPAYGIDGGKDFSVSYDNEIYLVSCKHYIRSGNHVGQDDEVNICDRLVQFNAKGFIGFYSTGITTGLQNRLDAICENQNRSYIIFDPSTIVTIMQCMDTKILQSFGLYPHKYYLNVADMEYQPLKCRICKKDCLTDENIPNSLIGLAKFKDGKYDYVYGCKSCFLEVELYLNLHLEMEQALHVGQLQGWEDKIDKIIENDRIELSEKFYKHRSKFLNCVRQRQLPQTEGTWYGIE